MAGNLLNTYIIGFDRAIRETVETKGGKMRPYIQLATGDLFRKEGVYQRTTGGGLPSKVTNRFGDSPVSDIDYSRRRITRNQFQDGQFMDWADLSKMGIDPRSQKLTVMKNKFLRQEDLIIDQALLNSGTFGGVEGQTQVNFGVSDKITDITNKYEKGIINVDVDGSGGSTPVGFNYGKFLETLTQFGNQSVDIETQKPLFKISWHQWQDIMNDDNFTDFDNRGGARVNEQGAGQIYDYMGASFCISNIVPFFASANPTASADFNIDLDVDVDTTTGVWKDTGGHATRACYAMIQDAALFEVNPDITTKISERADKSFNYYAYMKAEFGAVRMEEEKVIAIACKQ
jgi:hypothetical protein